MRERTRLTQTDSFPDEATVHVCGKVDRYKRHVWVVKIFVTLLDVSVIYRRSNVW